MLYNKIINPKTGRKVSIYGMLGKRILQHYLKGGSHVEELKELEWTVNSSFKPPKTFNKPLYLYYFLGDGISENLYKRFGHVGFSFDNHNLDDSLKTILGFGPLIEGAITDLNIFDGINGQLTDDTELFRDINKDKITINVVRLYIKNTIFDEYNDKSPEEYPKEDYGLPCFGNFQNCLTYPIKFLKPINYLGGYNMISGVSDSQGWSYMSDFGGGVRKLSTYFKNESKVAI